MIKLQELTEADFAPYGQVAQAEAGTVKALRDGQVRLTRSPARFEHSDEALDFALDLYEVAFQPSPLIVRAAERHPHSCQMFIPVRTDRYLVLVWADRPTGADEPLAFIAQSDQTVIYHPGIWHHGIVALGSNALFASAMWRTRGGTDTEFAVLDGAVSIELPQNTA